MEEAILAQKIYDAILEHKPTRKKWSYKCHVCNGDYTPTWQGSVLCSEKCTSVYDRGYPSYYDVKNSPEYHITNWS